MSLSRIQKKTRNKRNFLENKQFFIADFCVCGIFEICVRFPKEFFI